ncbi:MAG: hypothetical protein ACRDTC_02230 [Pseudonocardiaceae bacterium]
MTPESTPSADGPDVGCIDQANHLAAMIDQLQENWDLGDEVANDDLVVQIRKHIHRQRLSVESSRRRR